jgi:hypothetical protein
MQMVRITGTKNGNNNTLSFGIWFFHHHSQPCVSIPLWLAACMTQEFIDADQANDLGKTVCPNCVLGLIGGLGCIPMAGTQIHFQCLPELEGHSIST